MVAWERLCPTVWVVDNGSAERDVAAVARACPEAHLIRNGTNLGFAGGNNRGIEAALETGDAPILLLNNDAAVAEADVARLLETLQEDETVGFVGPLLFEAGQGGRLLAAGGRNPVLHHHSHILELEPGPAVRPVEYVPGTVLLARADVFRRVGLLDEDYFFTMEVADLCRRAARAGYRSVVDTRARAHHALERSSELRRTLHTYYIVRNRFLFIRKFYPRAGWFLFFVWSLYSLALFLKLLPTQPDTARAVRLGWRDGLRGRFGDRNVQLLG